MRKIVLSFLFLVTWSGLIGQSLLWEDFSTDTVPPPGWSIDLHAANWAISETNYSGGAVPEAMFGFYPDFTGISRLISPVFDLTGITKVNLEFRHMIDNWSGGYTLGVATRTDTTGTWNIVWQVNVTNSAPGAFVSVPITNANVNRARFQFCFFFSGNTTGIDYWYIDNVSLYAPYAHDIRSEGILTGNQFVSGNPFTPSFQVRNIGRNSEDFSARFKLLDYQGNQVYEDSAMVSNLLMDNTRVINFANYALPDPDACYQAVYYPNLASDMDHTNDTLIKTINTYTHKKQEVMLEIATGTWCNYCPGAALGADDLLKYGDSVAVIEYHYNDIFSNTASEERINYYNIISFPTAFFDGTLSYSGGSHNTSMYTKYNPLYQLQIIVKSPFEMFIYGNHSGINYTVQVNVQKLGQFINTNTALHLALTEDHIYYPWEGQDSLQHVLRLMAPDSHGIPIDMTIPGSQTFSFSFTLGINWKEQNLVLNAFIQDTVTREIFDGYKINLTDLVVDGINPTTTTSDRIGTIYPNPVITSTVIPVFLEREENVEITIWSVMGKDVKTLFKGELNAGRTNLHWDGTDDEGRPLPGGIYYLRLEREGRAISRKIVLNK